MGRLLVAALAGTLFVAPSTRAQAPSSDLFSYVFFAESELRTRGTNVTDGDLGVNAGEIRATKPLSAPNSVVAADTVDIDPGSTCGELFSNNVEETGAGCGPAMPFTSPILGLEAACGFPETFPECGGESITVGKNGQQTLPPGVYGSVSVRNGGTLTLEGGEYVFCSLRLSRQAHLLADGPVQVSISGNMSISNGAEVGPGPGVDITACDLEFLVNGNSVSIRRQASVRAFVCAPSARLRAGKGADLVGTFAGDTVRADDLTAESCEVVPGTTTTISTTTTTTTTPPLCGNGIIDAGEDCDPPGSLTCPATSPGGSFTECSEVCTCPGEPVTTTTTVAEPTTTTVTTTSTTTPAPVCGNEVVEEGEQCDPPGSLTCPPDSPGGAFTECNEVCLCPSIVTTTTAPVETTTTTTVTTTTSTTTVTPVCGDGVVDPGEDCDPPGSLTCPPDSPGGAFTECLEGCVCAGTVTTTTAPETTTTTVETTTTTIGEETTTTTEPPVTTTTIIIPTTTTTLEVTTTTLEVTTTTIPTTTTTLEVTTTTIPTTTTTTTSSTTTTTIPVCDCCSALPSLFSFTTAAGGCGVNPPGDVQPARCVQGTNNGTACTTDGDCTGGGVCRGHLDCSGLYFGSGQPAGINLPGTVPDMGLSFSKVSSCTTGNPDLTAAVEADVPGPGCSTPAGTPSYGARHCTDTGCLFGAPLSLPNLVNPPTSTCVINRVAGPGTGSVECATGATTLNLPLSSEVYLTGPVLGTQACVTCTGGTPGMCGSGTCSGGPRVGMACTPETSALSNAYPTSHDCPQPVGTFIGTLPIPFALSTGTQTKTSFATGAQPRVFCGFCFDVEVSSAFANPPDPCVSDAECAARGDSFDSCRQHNNGAFRNPFATTYTETGSAPNACVGDGVARAATLVSAFCIPPSYDAIVDPSGELPGPGAVSLPGMAQFIP